jgi:hypothetical protein
MFSTTVLDTALGIVFTFLAVSLAASAITEAISSAVKWRSKTLLSGIQSILNDQDFNGLAQDLYKHALINPRFNGATTAKKDLYKLPAYIDSDHFAAAFMDVANLAAKAPGEIETQIASIPDTQIKQLLAGIFDRALGRPEAMRKELANWFDSCMDRVGGAYKRDAQMVTFGVALIIAAALNVSAIRVGMALWDQPELAKRVAATVATATADAAKADATKSDATKTPTAQDALNTLEAVNLPIGWPAAAKQDAPPPPSPNTVAAHDNIFGESGKVYGCGWWITTVLGWFVTAGATLFGAPFWFDALQKITRLKGAGASPSDKKQKRAAA